MKKRQRKTDQCLGGWAQVSPICNGLTCCAPKGGEGAATQQHPAKADSQMADDDLLAAGAHRQWLQSEWSGSPKPCPPSLA